MKNPIIALPFLALTSLFGVSDDSLTQFELAKQQYESGNQVSSCYAFDRLFEKGFVSSGLNLYFGLCKAGENKLDEAVSAYERSVMLNPQNLRAKLELAATYFRLGQTVEAKEELEQLLQEKLPKEAEENVRKLLQIIEQKKRHWSFSSTVFAGVGFDSNANANPAKEELIDFIAAEYKLDKADISADQKKASSFVEKGVNISALYDFKERGRFWATSLQGYSQVFSKSKEAELLYTSISTGPGIAQESYKISAPITLENVKLAGINLLNAASFSPNAAFRVGENTLANGYLKFQKKLFIEDSSKNSFVVEAGMGGFYKLTDGGIGGHLLVSKEKKESGNLQRFLDKDCYSFHLSYSKELFSFLSMSLGYLYKYSNFKDRFSAQSNEYREDRYQNFMFKLGHDFTKTVSASLNTSYTVNASNYSPAKYDKSVYSVSLQYAF